MATSVVFDIGQPNLVGGKIFGSLALTVKQLGKWSQQRARREQKGPMLS